MTYHGCRPLVGSRAFCDPGLQAWNQLPTSRRQINCVAIFKIEMITAVPICNSLKYYIFESWFLV